MNLPIYCCSLLSNCCSPKAEDQVANFTKYHLSILTDLCSGNQTCEMRAVQGPDIKGILSSSVVVRYTCRLGKFRNFKLLFFSSNCSICATLLFNVSTERPLSVPSNGIWLVGREWSENIFSLVLFVWFAALRPNQQQETCPDGQFT